MDYETFTAGVTLGGLRTQNDIRIVICYILNSVKQPLTMANLEEILQGRGIANYFEVSDALSALVKNGNVTKSEDGFYTLEPSGELIANRLDVDLPLSIRDNALEAAINLLATIKRDKENFSESVKTDNGYNVTCHISGGDFELMKFTVYVPDYFQSKTVKRNFQKNPETIYKILLASVTGNRDLIKSLLNEL